MIEATIEVNLSDAQIRSITYDYLRKLFDLHDYSVKGDKIYRTRYLNHSILYETLVEGVTETDKAAFIVLKALETEMKKRIKCV